MCVVFFQTHVCQKSNGVRHQKCQIAMGKERGYLLSDEINDVLPADAHSSEDTETLILTIERSGIDVYEDVSAADAARRA
jgi:Sigma-70 factor, region 1.1